jgi:signal peptidase I
VSDDAPVDEPDVQEPDSSAKPAKRVKKKRSFLKEFPLLIAAALILSFLVRTFLVQPFVIPSASMEKTLHGCPGCTGDRILANRIVYRFRSPRDGDIVVFRGPPSWASEVTPVKQNAVQKVISWIGGAFGLPQANEEDFVKRVIATGGQTVACCDSAGRVTVDGKALNEPYIYQNNPLDERRFGPVTVPKGRLWVMGDHRGDSSDSRFHMTDNLGGTIPVGNVIGKAFVIIWPPSRWNTLGP